MIPEELFEPTVIFFGLTNSPAMFQTIINEILWDLINTREVVSFINNVIIGIEKEEEHNELEVDIIEKIKIAREKDKEVVRVVEEMKKAGVKVLRGNKWQVKGDLVLKEGKVYIPKNEKLRIEIIQPYHNIPVAGYRKRWKITELVTRNYWWPEITKDIGKCVDGRNMC